METYDNLSYTCMFGGGAIRGAAHAGVVKCFEELGIKPSIFVGSSVGALVAMLYAVGYNADELAEVFLSVNFELFRDISLGFNQQFALSKGEVFLNWLRELIEKKYYKDKYVEGKNAPVKFSDLQNNLIIITTDMYSFKCKEFSTFETPDYEVAMAVRISCCMPGLMRAVHVGDKLLVDGDLMKSKPMWMHSKNLTDTKDRILEIRLEGEFLGTDEKVAEYVNGMYSCMTSTGTDFIKDIYGISDKYDYLIINTGSVVVVDFNYPTEKRQAIIDEGYRQTKKYFTKTIIEKKKNILTCYNYILENLRKVYSFLQRGKYIPAKNLTAELFIYLADYRKIMDETLYHSIRMFQKFLFNNVKSGLLGRATCTNKQTIINSLNLIIADLELRTDAIEKYLVKFSN